MFKNIFNQTSGVFLIIRCSPLFEYSEDILLLVTLLGAMTSFFAATIGIVQYDLKRVIAYSTCSQLLRFFRIYNYFLDIQ
jgi:NADH:ubiquinone oxidoreductase subunit 5 (subunit L)/multisubunit Na+/H+ antiporter MnhA subunit